jgi:hypothetical protein
MYRARDPVAVAQLFVRDDQCCNNRHKNLAYKIEVGDVTLVAEYTPKDHKPTVLRSVWVRGRKRPCHHRHQQQGWTLKGSPQPGEPFFCIASPCACQGLGRPGWQPWERCGDLSQGCRPRVA